MKRPTRAHASRPAGLANSSGGLPPPGATTAYTLPAEAAICSMVPPSEILRQCVPPSRVHHSAGPYSHPSRRLANTTLLTLEARGPRAGSRSRTSGVARNRQCAPLSAVAISRAAHAWPGRQPTAPRTKPEAGDWKLADAGWNPAAGPARPPLGSAARHGRPSRPHPPGLLWQPLTAPRRPGPGRPAAAPSPVTPCGGFACRSSSPSPPGPRASRAATARRTVHRAAKRRRHYPPCSPRQVRAGQGQ